MTISFSIHDVDGIEKWLKEKLKTPTKRALVSTAFRVVSHIVNELIPQENLQPVFRGYYRAGWKVELTEKGADVVNTLPYASVVEFGARPENIKIGREMIEALTEWARIKLGAEDPKAAAWAIAMAMKGTAAKAGKGIFNRDGRQGLRIGERAALKVVGFFKEELKHEYARE